MTSSGSRVVVRVAIALGAFAPILAASQQPQPPQTGSGVILGRVLDAGSRQPVAHATVSLSPARQQVLTDAEGRFVFFDVAAGRFTLTASKSGYLFGELGRDWPGAYPQSLELGETARVRDLTLLIWKYGRVSGTVVDEIGEPVVGAQVQAWGVSYRAGRRFINTRAPTIVRTDDRGWYRIGDLAPGYTYAIVVHVSSINVPQLPPGARIESAGRGLIEDFYARGLPMPELGTPHTLAVGDRLAILAGPGTSPPGDRLGRASEYRTTFFPNAETIARAELINVVSGTNRAGVDFQLTPRPVTSVSGTVTGPKGPAAGVSVRLKAIAADDIAMDLEAGLTSSDASGRFVFFSVPAGRYTVEVLEPPRADSGFAFASAAAPNATAISMVSVASGSPEPTLWASVPLVVGAQPLTDVSVPLQIGARLNARLEFRGTAPAPIGTALSRIRVNVDRADGRAIGWTPGEVTDRGEFRTVGLPPGRYFLRVDIQPSGWTFESAMLEGRDLSQTPLDLGGADVTGIALTFTDTPTQISGTVRTAAGDPDPTAVVLVFPPSRDRWLDFGATPPTLRRARVTRQGTFSITGLPPGTYTVVARHAEGVTNDWMHASFLAALGPGQTLTIARGEKRALDLVRSDRR